MNIEMIGQEAYNPFAEISTPDIEYGQTREFAPSYTDIVYPNMYDDYAEIKGIDAQIIALEKEKEAIREPSALSTLFQSALSAFAGPKTGGQPPAMRKPDYTPYLVLGGGAIAVVAILAMNR